MSAIIANPGVTYASSEIELGFFGHQQDAPAAGTVRSAEIKGRRGRFGVAGELDAHRRISSTVLSPHPIDPYDDTLPGVCGDAATCL